MKVINTPFILGARLFRNFQDIYIVSIIFGKVLFEVHIIYNQDLNGRITHHYFYKMPIFDRKPLSENFEERPDACLSAKKVAMLFSRTIRFLVEEKTLAF